jgi:hypothetical protein
MSEDLRRCVLDGISVRGRIRVEGLYHCFYEFGKIGTNYKWFLREISELGRQIKK